MNVKLKVLTAGVLFFTGQAVMAQETKKDKEREIEEVVVVAFGKLKKEEVTGSVTQIKSEAIKDVPASNVVSGLAGKVAGVQVFSSGQPGSAPTVRMRGIGSINASNQPLYVVDGVPFQGDIASLSSQDIESMTFLKDASANALYGARGANGVIIITTKKGKKGLSFDFETRVGVSTRGTKDYDVIKTPGEFYEAFYQRSRIGFYNDPTTQANANALAAADVYAKLKYNNYNVPNGQIIDPTTGKLNGKASLLYSDDWYKYLFSPSMRYENNLSVSSGTDKASTYMSLGHLKDEGYAINTGFERFSARINSEYKYNSNIKFGGNIMYSNTKQNAPTLESNYSNLFTWARNTAPIFPVYLRNGKGEFVYNSKGEKTYDFGDTTQRPWGAQQNPYATMLANLYDNSYDNLSSRFFATVNFWKDFEFTYNFAADLRNRISSTYYTPIGGDGKNFGGRLSETYGRTITVNNQQLLSYNKKINNHNISILVGHETNNYKNKHAYGEKTKFVISDLPVFSNSANIEELSGGVLNYFVEGYFSRLNYSFANKYFFNASVRRDGSSVFHEDNRWGTFYGIGAAWTVTNENFLKGNSILNNLKLKLSYGQQGNDNLLAPNGVDRAYYPYTDLWVVSDAGGGVPSLGFDLLGNKDITWEKSKNFNTGFEISLFNRRLNIDAEYFSRGVDDLLFYFPAATSMSPYVQPRNVGAMNNKGIEVSIDGDIIRNENVKLSLYANATHFKNKITSLAKPFIQDGLYRLREGGSRYDYYIREFAGVDATNGDALWYTEKNNINGVANKKINDRFVTNSYANADRYFVDKTSIPDLYGGFGLDLKVGRLSLRTSFAYQIGGMGYDSEYAGLLPSGGDIGHNFHKDVYKTWTPENPNAALPALDLIRPDQMATSTLFLTSMSYLSLQDVTVGYEMPKNFLETFNLNYARIYLTGNNLFLLSKRQGFDPRISSIGRSTTGYSTMRNISLGINFKF